MDQRFTAGRRLSLWTIRLLGRFDDWSLHLSPCDRSIGRPIGSGRVFASRREIVYVVPVADVEEFPVCCKVCVSSRQREGHDVFVVIPVVLGRQGGL